ncbi:hypothetical protein SSX86_018361 [Deinandra increscens subsp. villosa]|uniref:non-specific serine/threonine protein kinase n=1 Tax=Deinandra increscens subsp. villosa TaxID=3103831 RepID=A0AAP0CQK5_9ASTR
MAEIQQLQHLKIPLEDIVVATNNFAEDTLIGKGGFGRVYKGQLPRSGESSITVAIKRLDETMTGQGMREFGMEILLLASYKHTNLVSLVGFSDEGAEKILVYKYELNGSLDKLLDSPDLTWERRLRICLGAARGLEYLHAGVGTSHRVIHRDIKSSNILLDFKWEAKISDFGLSKIGPMNQELTFLFSNASGTSGYIDPEYQNTGVLSKESDVYSFGVVMFEVLCGRLATIVRFHDERRFLSSFVKRHYREGGSNEIIMGVLRDQIKPYSLQTFSRVAYWCLNETRNQRPWMKMVVQELQSSFEYQIGSPTRLWGSNTGGHPWSLLLDNNNLKLRKIEIDHKGWIFSLGFTVEDLNGSSISSHYGGNGGPSGDQPSEISFDEDEEITEILGTVGETPGRVVYTIISSLCIVTNKRRHERFGRETGTNFSISWDIGSFAGFYGRAGFYLDGLGFYSKTNTV